MYLVTGSTGHIGNVLVRKLVETGEQVRALILPGEDTTSIEGLPVEKVTGDVLDVSSLFAAFRGVRGVFHLAGVISILPGENPQVWAVNVEGTKNVLKAAVQCGIERLVYTSSIHAIQRVESGIIDESLPYDPHNPYGAYDRSKAAATLEVQQAARQGLNAVITCPTGVIGPFDYRQSLMGAIIRTAARQQPTLYVDGAYDFVDVRDVADGLIGAARRGRPGESYILSGQKISVRYLLETVREVTGRGFFQLKIPLNVAKWVSSFMPHYYRLTRSSPRFTPYALEVLRSNANISHAKATRELGYAPRTLYESIRDTITWLLNNPH